MSRTSSALKKCTRRRTKTKCVRLQRHKCLTRRGTTKKSSYCRSLSRKKGKLHRGKHRKVRKGSVGRCISRGRSPTRCVSLSHRRCLTRRGTLRKSCKQSTYKTRRKYRVRSSGAAFNKAMRGIGTMFA